MCGITIMNSESFITQHAYYKILLFLSISNIRTTTDLLPSCSSARVSHAVADPLHVEIVCEVSRTFQLVGLPRWHRAFLCHQFFLEPFYGSQETHAERDRQDLFHIRERFIQFFRNFFGVFFQSFFLSTHWSEQFAVFRFQVSAFADY